MLAAQRARGSSSLGPARQGRTLSRCLITATDVAHKCCTGTTVDGWPNCHMSNAVLLPHNASAQQLLNNAETPTAAVSPGACHQHTMRLLPERSRPDTLPHARGKRALTVHQMTPHTKTVTHRAFRPKEEQQPVWLGHIASVDRTRTFRHCSRQPREGCVRPLLSTSAKVGGDL